MSWMKDVPLWDQHCHALVGPRRADDMKVFAQAFTEAPDTYPIRDIYETVAYQQALSTVAQKLGTSLDPAVVKKALGRLDFSQYCRELLNAGGYQKLLVDTGFAPNDAWNLDELRHVLALDIYPILRIENTAQECLSEFNNIRDWVAAIKDVLGRARQMGYVGVKSIIAYRSGLRIYAVDQDDAEKAFEDLRRDGQSRLSDPRILNYLLWEITPALIEAALPIQFHTGYGDPDTDLVQGNPLWLRNYLEHFVPRGLRVVLLHTYPYHREAGYLASVYPHVYFDVSLALPLAAGGATRIVKEALELAPASRFLFASDSHSRPESFFLAARLWKEALDAYFDGISRNHHIMPSVLERWAAMIGWQNCRTVYQL